MSKSSHGGHFITIQSNINVTSSSLSTRPEIKELINNLVRNQSVTDNAKNSQMNIQLSSVIFNKYKQISKSDNRLSNHNDNNDKFSVLSIREIAEEMLENIQRRRKVINIFEERKQIAKFVHFFKNKFKKKQVIEQNLRIKRLI